MDRPLLMILGTALLATAGAADAQRRHEGRFSGAARWGGPMGPPPPMMRGPPPGAIDPRALPRRMRDQDAAFAARRAGEIRSLRDIEARVIPHMRGADYLGPEFDAGSATYRLKFMRRGSVIWLDVDGRTGQVVGRSGE